MDVKDSQISSDEYDKLRNFYSQVVSAESEQLVIGPKVNPAENTDPSSKKVNVGSK